MSSNSWLSQILLYSVFASSFISYTCSAYSCFFPNGGAANNYTACSPTGDGSCCADGDFCTAFGYCVSNTKGYHYRGACTDSTWGNPSCPIYCLAGTNSGNSSAVNVIACNAAQSGGTWCCAYDGNCCSSSTFTPGFGTIFAEGATPSTAPAGSATSATSVGQSGMASSLTVPSATGSKATFSSLPESSSANDRTATIVGAGVGVPLGLIALAGLIFFVLERNKRKAIERDTTWDRSKLNTGSSTASSTDFGPKPLAPPIRAPTGAPVYMRPYELPSDKNHELGV